MSMDTNLQRQIKRHLQIDWKQPRWLQCVCLAWIGISLYLLNVAITDLRRILERDAAFSVIYMDNPRIGFSIGSFLLHVITAGVSLLGLRLRLFGSIAIIANELIALGVDFGRLIELVSRASNRPLVVLSICIYNGLMIGFPGVILLHDLRSNRVALRVA